MNYIKLICIFGLCLAAEGISAQFKYEELPDPAKATSWKTVKKGINVSFATADVRFKKTEPPVLDVVNEWSAKAWKGEKVHTQVLIWTTRNVKALRIEVGNLQNEEAGQISAKNIHADFLRYVMTDRLTEAGGGCGIPFGLDSSLVADVIDHHSPKLDVKANQVQPVWLSITVPELTKAGTYTGWLEIKEENLAIKKLKISVQVLNHTLPVATKWRYHLDLWQNPFADARVNQVEPWSEAHFSAMKPLMQRLADAGQKAITASIIYDPWNGQTYDIYQSMIRWKKNKDGTWNYDYTAFDSWVSFMMGLGIDQYINCYSMIPWNLKFYYFDEATGKDIAVVAQPGSDAYNNHWRPMLKDFARHLKSKGWFEKTTIAMDERQMADMQKAIALVKSADSDFKVSLAGNYHKEIQNDLVDYSLASNQLASKELLTSRNAKNYNTTFYTCCAEGYPNTFTFSPPAESAWLAWHAANKGYSGYLRWAYNCWNKNPLQDTRFGSWSAGDAFLVYPGNRTSIRFERLLEGIQDFEKLRILKEQFKDTKQSDQLNKLTALVKPFEINALKNVSAAEMVNKAHDHLNKF